MRRRPAWIAGCALLAMVAACSSGAGSGGSTAATPPPLTSSSNQPTTATTPSAPSTPNAEPSSATPDPEPSSTAPLSRFESDPGVAGLRRWAVVAAQTVNSGHYISAALRRLMTPAQDARMKQTMGTDVGMHYPGPIPFTPLRVAVTSRTSRRISACFVSAGFALRPKTGTPKRLKLIAVRADEIRTHGRWVLDGLFSVPSFSCAHVHVPMPTF